MSGRWEDPGVVRGFSTAAPNEVLLALVRTELARKPRLRVLDLGCGAARNAAPMAAEGATVIGIDAASPMLDAARRRVADAGLATGSPSSARRWTTCPCGTRASIWWSPTADNHVR